MAQKTHEIEVLVLGSGGREHAIAWKMAQSPHVSKVYVAPGNAGTALESKVENVNIDISDPVKIARFAWPKKIDLTIVGPDQLLADGVVDVFEDAGLRILGPRRIPAQLETSKTFAKNLLVEAGVNTAPYFSVTDQAEAREYIKSNFKDGEKIVIKADGLALGKGVFIKKTIAEAVNITSKLLIDGILGTSGRRIVIEKFIEGVEVSLTALVSKLNVVPFEIAQDYKKLNCLEGAPNTGGMGAYSPVFGNSDTDKKYDYTKATITPVIAKLINKNIMYKGFIYAGLVIDKHGVPWVLEFNARLGDPEAEVLLLRLKSDFYELCSHAVNEDLNDKFARWDEESAVGVVLASGGYPGKYDTDVSITGLRKTDGIANTKVFHCGTKKGERGEIVTNGGRVLLVCGVDRNVDTAASRAYERIERIKFDNMYYRKDIGKHISVTI